MKHHTPLIVCIHFWTYSVCVGCQRVRCCLDNNVIHDNLWLINYCPMFSTKKNSLFQIRKLKKKATAAQLYRSPMSNCFQRCCLRIQQHIIAVIFFVSHALMQSILFPRICMRAVCNIPQSIYAFLYSTICITSF